MWNSYYYHFILLVLLRRQLVFHWHLYKPVERVLNGQPVLSGQLAIPQGWPFNTGLTVNSKKNFFVF